MKSSTQWLTQQRLKSSLVVMNYSTTAAGGAKKAILAGTVSQLFCGLPPFSAEPIPHLFCPRFLTISVDIAL